MIIRHHHDNKIYRIEVPPGTRISRSAAAGTSVVNVPTRRGEVPIFDEPGELLIQVAQSGRHGLRLLGTEEVPGASGSGRRGRAP